MYGSTEVMQLQSPAAKRIPFETTRDRKNAHVS